MTPLGIGVWFAGPVHGFTPDQFFKRHGSVSDHRASISCAESKTLERSLAYFGQLIDAGNIPAGYSITETLSTLPGRPRYQPPDSELFGAVLRADEYAEVRNPREDFSEELLLRDDATPDLLEKPRGWLCQCRAAPRLLYSSRLLAILPGMNRSMMSTVTHRGHSLDGWLLGRLSKQCSVIWSGSVLDERKDLAGARYRPLLGTWIALEDAAMSERVAEDCLPFDRYGASRPVVVRVDYAALLRRNARGLLLENLYHWNSETGVAVRRAAELLEGLVRRSPGAEQRDNAPPSACVERTPPSISTASEGPSAERRAGGEPLVQAPHADETVVEPAQAPKPVEGGRAFQTTSYWFLVEGEEKTPAAFPDAAEISEEELDARLTSSGRIPALGNAPVASWVLARLAAITRGDIGVSDGTTQHNDGGCWVLELLVYRLDRTVVGELQLQGGSDGVAVFGSCVPAEQPEQIVAELTAALLGAPQEVRVFRVRVRDPEDGSRHTYGWDGKHYLGR